MSAEEGRGRRGGEEEKRIQGHSDLKAEQIFHQTTSILTGDPRIQGPKRTCKNKKFHHSAAAVSLINGPGCFGAAVISFYENVQLFCSVPLMSQLNDPMTMIQWSLDLTPVSKCGQLVPFVLKVGSRPSVIYPNLPSTGKSLVASGCMTSGIPTQTRGMFLDIKSNESPSFSCL